MLYRVAVVVHPREGVSDPEGETLNGRLRRKGITGVKKVRSGRYWEIFIEANSEEQAQASAQLIYTGPPMLNPVKDNARLLSIEEVR